MSNQPDHIDDHDFTRALRREFESVPGTAPLREDWDSILSMRAAEAEQSHRAAVFIMHEYQATKRPFALFLRSFEPEAYNYLTPDDSDSGRRSITTLVNRPTHVEEKVAAALCGKMGVLGIANPSQLVGSPPIPRLQLPSEGWQEVVRNLVENAHLIVMDCDSLAPGVLWELETIRDAGRQAETVVVLSSAEHQEQWLLREAAVLLGAEASSPETPTSESPELATFPRVALEDKIDFDHLDSSRLFADLLASAASAVAGAPPFEPKRYATLLNNEGAAHVGQGRFAQGLQLYEQALLIRRHLDDRPGILSSLINISVVYIDAGEPADALPILSEGMRLAEELNNVADLGLLTSHTGLVHKLLGHAPEARAWLSDAYHLQAEYGEPQDVEDTVAALAQLFQDDADGDGMVACFDELRTYYARRGDRAGELRATMQLAATYYSAEHPATAELLFEEAAALARDTGDTEREDLSIRMLERIQADRETSGSD